LGGLSYFHDPTGLTIVGLGRVSGWATGSGGLTIVGSLAPAARFLSAFILPIEFHHLPYGFFRTKSLTIILSAIIINIL